MIICQMGHVKGNVYNPFIIAFRGCGALWWRCATNKGVKYIHSGPER
jgi:hypothetical protein